MKNLYAPIIIQLDKSQRGSDNEKDDAADDAAAAAVTRIHIAISHQHSRFFARFYRVSRRQTQTMKRIRFFLSLKRVQ